MADNENSPWWKPDGEWAFAGFALAIFLVCTGLAGLVAALTQESAETQGLWRGVSGVFALVVTLVLYRRWKVRR
jgi:uncharacterized membrane protein HdeD (DUF308 family)